MFQHFQHFRFSKFKSYNMMFSKMFPGFQRSVLDRLRATGPPRQATGPPTVGCRGRVGVGMLMGGTVMFLGDLKDSKKLSEKAIN